MSDLNKLIHQRGIFKSQLTRFKTFITNYKEEQLTELQTRLIKIESLWDNFEEIQSQIELEDTSTDHNSDREEFEKNYYFQVAAAKSILQNKSANLTQTNAPQNVTLDSNSGANLPKLNLPEFYGSYEKWLQFADTYKAMIHNNISLNNIQKFWYLKSCIKGEATNTLSALEVSETNYIKAWELLCQRE